MAIIQVKDANNKEFTIDDIKIFDINGDIGENESKHITDSARSRIQVHNEVQYVNANGETVDSNQILKDSASGKINIIALDVQTEATHSGKNHNYCIYYEDSMERDAESFINPFKKPMLKNHNSYSEPLGRTKSSWFGPSKLTDERSAIHLVTRVTDKDAIEKFLDGRYSTVSIGGSMGTVTCNICGKTILKDGQFKFCGHWRGETYKDQVCYWGAKDIEYHEVSTVNNPADDFAQVVKVTVITDEDDKKNNDKKSEGSKDMKDNQPETNQNQSTREKFISMIDELLGTNNDKTTDNSSTPSIENNTDTKENKDNNSQGEDITVKLADAENKIKELETKLADAEKLKAEVETKLADAENEVKIAKQQCIDLALANKSLITDQIIDYEIANKKLEDSKIDERRKELADSSMKELTTVLKDAKTAFNTTDSSSQQRQPGVVQNPTLPNTGENNSIVGDENKGKNTSEDKSEQSSKRKSIDDYTKDFINRMSKR